MPVGVFLDSVSAAQKSSNGGADLQIVVPVAPL
jgi:hypothetical protein